LPEFRMMSKSAKDLSDKHAGKMYRVYPGDGEYANKEHLILDFEVWSAYQDDEKALSMLGNHVKTEEEVLQINGMINTFGIMVLFENENQEKKYVKFSQFLGANSHI